MFGFPVTSNPKTGLFYTSYPLLVFSYLLMLSIPVTWCISADSHWPKLSVMNPFHLVLSWFHIRFYEILAVALLLLMVIQHKEIALILNERRSTYQYLETFHPEVPIEKFRAFYSRRLWTLWSFLLLRIANVVIYARDALQEIHNLHLSLTMWQLKFPFFVFMLVNNLFLEAITFLAMLVRKLRLLLEKGLRDTQSVHTQGKLSDLLDQVAEGYSRIYRHKERIKTMTSYSMLLLTIQRFLEIIIRVFYIYSLCRGDLLYEINVQLLFSQLIDLLVVTLELYLIARATEDLQEEVGTEGTPVETSHAFSFSFRDFPNRSSIAAAALSSLGEETISPKCLHCS